MRVDAILCRGLLKYEGLFSNYRRSLKNYGLFESKHTRDCLSGCSFSLAWMHRKEEEKKYKDFCR